MEQIVLEVDDTVGEIYHEMSKASKQQLSQTVSLMMKKALVDATFADYSKTAEIYKDKRQYYH